MACVQWPQSVRSRKSIYVRFDLNDYSIPPEAVGRQLTLAASDTSVRILDGSVEIAHHVRTYNRHQLILDPGHQEAVLKIKRKAFHSTLGGRLEIVVPESKTLLDRAFAQGESAGAQTAQLMRQLEDYGAAALRRAILEALQRGTPRDGEVTTGDIEPATYIASVLTLYADLPDTPARPGPTDQVMARKLHADAVPLSLVESALLLATSRRLVRSADLPSLPKIRSLAYFLPVIAELQQQPLPAGYLDYLRLKVHRLSLAPRLNVQKSTFLHER